MQVRNLAKSAVYLVRKLRYTVVIMKPHKLTLADINHIARLANLNPSKEQLTLYRIQLTKILDYISQIQTLATSGVSETPQVTGLYNIMRDDVIEPERTFSQEDALVNA